MKKLFFLLGLFVLFFTASTRAASTTVVISQVFGGGGNASSVYKNDFIELFNKSDSPVNLAGWSVQYSSSVGTSWTTANSTILSGTIQPYSYFLIQESTGGAGTTSLPTPDLTGSIAIAAGAGKVALCNTTNLLTGAPASVSGGNIVDFVGFGAASAYEGTGPAPGPANNTTAIFRASGGCTDTDSNTNDFTIATTSPRNSSSSVNICSGSGPTGPAISIDLHNVSVNEGGTTNFSVIATGTAPLYYQWQKNGTNTGTISTSNTLSFSPAALSDAGTYQVIVSNAVSTTTSSTATLTVNLVGPTITVQPLSVVANSGSNATFSITATGSAPLNYQWYKSNAIVSAATNSSLTVSNATTVDAGSYFCIVSNSVNSATSSVVTLTIAANTFLIMQYNLNGNSITGTDPTNWAATAPQVLAIGREITYLKPDILMINEMPSAYEYQIATWPFLTNYFLATNAAGDGFIENAIASKFPIIASISHLHGTSLTNFGYTNTSKFTRDLFEAEIAVPGLASTLHVFQAHLKATTTSPQDDASKRAAEAASISNYLTTVYLPSAAGTHPYVLCGDLNEDAFFPETNHYTSGHPLQSLTAAATGLQMTDPVNPFTSKDYTESIRDSLSTRFDYILPCSTLYANILNNQVFRTDLLSPVPSGLNANDDSVASDHLPVLMTFFVPSASAPFIGTDVANTTNLAGTTATLSVIAGGGTPLTYQWYKGAIPLSNGGNILGSSSAALTINNVLAADAGSYSVAITNAIGSTNSSVAVLTVIDPAITTQPVNQTIFQTSNAVFSATAAGTGPLTYQWRKGTVALTEGSGYTGTTTTNLTIANATTSFAGSYNLVVTGSAGTNTSSNAVLTVIVPLAVTTQPASRTNNATTTATFNIAVSGTTPVYQWLRNGSPLTNGGNILGSTTSTLSVTNVLAADAATYSVIVTNAAGSLTSSGATLTVIDPAILTQPKDTAAQAGGSAVFTVTAGGTPTLSYRWNKNGSPLTDGDNIIGAATAALTLNPVSTSDIASYSVVVTGLGTVTSTSALLTVTTATGEIVQLGTTYGQNFDGVGTGTNLPPGWVMSAAGASAPVFQTGTNSVNQVVGSGSPTTGGRYNWGNGTTTTDRALGFMTSGGYASPNSLMAGFYNNLGSTITALTFGFDYERYRTNTSAASVTFFISLDGTNWTAQTSGDSGAFDTAASAYSFTGGTVISKSFTVSGLSVPANTPYYVRWNFSTVGANSQGLGLDNFTVTATTSAPIVINPTIKALLTPSGFNLLWPTNGADGFVLQSLTNFNNTNWQTVSGAAISGTNYTITLSATNDTIFFRLKK